MTQCIKSCLVRANNDQIQDIVCIGFGPASLAIAIALHDAWESGASTIDERAPKVRFLERQREFTWHSGMLLPGTKMQITFLKDLATFRSPRSHFTFLNYLHQMDRLAAFTNLGTFLPERVEYADYMHWCAGHFADVVDYNQDVQKIETGRLNRETGAIETFRVISSFTTTGPMSVIEAKHVIIAVGGTPNFPKEFPSDHPKIIHSSQYATRVSDMFPDSEQPRSIAVVGGGQSAAEIFYDIPFRFPDAKSTLLIRSGALRPSDDSPFVNEIFDADRVDDIFSQDPKIRSTALALDRSTNYGVVRLELLEKIYARLYSYRVNHRCEEEWPQRILNHRTVVGVSDCNIDDKAAVKMHIKDDSGAFCADKKKARDEALTADLVVLASGYVRSAHEDLLKGLKHLRPQANSSTKSWTVNRDYSVEFMKGYVQRDAGVWLQGCNESTHGLSDTLLSILAVRGGEMVDSIFGSSHRKGDKRCQNGFASH